MSRLGTRGRRYFLITTVLTVLLMGTLVVQAGAHPGHGGRHTDAPNVIDTFNPSSGSFFGGVFPASITCEWRHRPQGQPVNAYVCTDGGGREQRLSNQNDVNQGLLLPGDTAALPSQVENPEEFRCDRQGNRNTPNDYACRYETNHHGVGRHTHFFRMDEMVMMEDPEALFDPQGQEIPDPHGRQRIYYVWPPHK